MFISILKRLLAALWLAFLVVRPISADMLLLLQGYLGDDDPWRDSGAAAALSIDGWVDGGRMHPTPRGAVLQGPDRGAKRYYTVDLPSEAPLFVQLQVLVPQVEYLRTHHPEERLFLAGHSAGGVLARLYMVTHPKVPVAALITIASPHLGTGAAELGLMAGDSPLGFLAPLVGGSTLNRSQGLYADLVRQQPGTLLGWLNFQPHPQAVYISLVRDDQGLKLGDMVVAPESQDLRSVYALRGRARSIRVPGDHTLTREDGERVAALLRGIQ